MSETQIYTVVCTDINDYVNWQVDLLEYSWSKVNQPGKLIRLVAASEDEVLPEHRHAQVYRTRPTSHHPETGDHYPPYNRLYSLQQWLDEQPTIKGTILVVDCDVVFTKTIKQVAVNGKPIGTHWLDFVVGPFKEAIESINDIDTNSFQPVTWPMLIDADDLRALLLIWIESTVAIRQQTQRQESDMFGMLVAANEIELNFELANLTAFMPWQDADVKGFSLIHYCQVVKDIYGERIWGKWRYQPWEPIINIDAARLIYGRTLLKLINEFGQIERSEETQAEQTIFIAIAAYCDAELVDTIQSCLTKARRPENLRFGICLQYDNSEQLTSAQCLDRFSQDRRFRYVQYDYKESKGGCWAREIAQQLYDGEDYTLQIDSHTQMAESWDSILMKMLNDLPAAKPILTYSPPLYTRTDDGVKSFSHTDNFNMINTAVFKQWSQGGWVDYVHELLPENDVFPRYERVLSGGFVFTTGEWVNVVRQDPNFLYVGEEFALTLRSFTHGYDLFVPNQIVCWHRQHPTTNRKFRNDNKTEQCQEMHSNAIHRLQILMQGDPENQLGRYTLGAERTLQQFAAITGIDCVNRTLSKDAQSGEMVSISAIQALNNQSAEIETENDTMTTSNNLTNNYIDVTVHTKTTEPLLLVCDEQNPILVTLFAALQHKSVSPNAVIYLEIGSGDGEKVYFKYKELAAIETFPALSEEFFSSLPALNNQISQQSNQQLNHHQAVTEYPFSDDWKIWIWATIKQGYGKDQVFKHLIEKGFSWHAVSIELNFQPAVPLEQISTPNFSQLSQSSQHSPLQEVALPDYEANAMAKSFGIAQLPIYQTDDFLNEQECQQLLAVIKANHERSRVVGNQGGEVSSHRTSSSCSFDVNNQDHQLAFEVRDRVCQFVGIDPSFAEQIQGQLYEKGQEYKAHYDWFEPGTDGYKLEASDEKGSQRTWSAIIYLNDVVAGGETNFDNVGLSCHPKLGRIIFWHNLCADGSPNFAALHQACPVLEGHKAVLTLWFREKAIVNTQKGDHDHPWSKYKVHDCDRVPAYTVNGFDKSKMSEDLYVSLHDYYQQCSENDKEDEDNSDGFLVNEDKSVPTEMIGLSDDLGNKIIREFLPICEQWSEQELTFSALYGIREYARGTSLKLHTDIMETHIISVILNVAQHVEADWPLVIEDHVRRRHEIMLSPGEYLLYEGARLRHGRPYPLIGKSFANIFLHFRPKH